MRLVPALTVLARLIRSFFSKFVLARHIVNVEIITFFLIWEF